jgi:hypothetical protein
VIVATAYQHYSTVSSGQARPLFLFLSRLMKFTEKYRGRVCRYVFIEVSAYICMSIYICIIFLKKFDYQTKSNKVFSSYKILFLELATPFLVKHHQNFRTELLYHRVLKHNCYRWERNHDKHTLNEFFSQSRLPHK